VISEPAPRRPGEARGSGDDQPTWDFSTGDVRGRIDRRFLPPGTETQAVEEIGRILDPASAVRTLHWGRNYIYLVHLRTGGGPLPLAVKQFPGGGWRRRLRRRLRGSKAKRSWDVARSFRAAGLLTPEPVLMAESSDPDGATWFGTRHLEDVFEARYLLRAVNDHREAEVYPHVDVGLFLDTLGRTVRRLHGAGLWHRDLSSGNVLVRWHENRPPDLYLVDLNRARQLRRLSLSQRSRDLSRMMIHRREHQERFLRAYWEDDPRRVPGRRLYRLYHWSFRTKNEVKNRVRGVLRRVRGWLFSRGAHPHIPRAPEGAAARDRVVWDSLSDQPHLHASRLDKLRARLADTDAHLSQTAALFRALPRVRRRYKELRRSLYSEPSPFTGAGVAVRPWPEGTTDPEPLPELLAAVEDLGTRPVLLRLHPWAADHTAEEALARELAARSHELTFTLPQNRELVRDLAQGGSRWREAVAELAERFTPYGSVFQVGQAVNRSKWGVWNAREWAALTAVAARELRRYPGVRILGPAVIDFEVHQTVGLLNLSGAGIEGIDDLRLDALASLLYVDRRGAPENRQLGFDTVDKVVVLEAVAETARHCGPESWITEVNWPLREGPHSPAGKGVSVDEETQADYLVRFYVLTLATGLVRRVFWWQMVARGYGLIEPPESAPDGFRRRPAFRAFAHLLSRLTGAVSLGPLAAPPEARLYRFRPPPGTGPEGVELAVGWALTSRVEAELPAPAERVWGRDGEELPAPADPRVTLVSAPRYFQIAGSSAPAGTGPDRARLPSG
jgi:tRNA A-37 threonylcarbamoyl transferase component Bud32